jgi:hypothetical protein
MFCINRQRWRSVENGIVWVRISQNLYSGRSSYNHIEIKVK